MQHVRLTTVGAWSAILMFPTLILGAASLAASGAEDLLPPTGAAGETWLRTVAGHTQQFTTGGWLLILMGFLAMTAFVGFYETLRRDSEVLILAPIMGLLGMTMVQVSHLIPIAMAAEVAPAFAAEPTGPAETSITTLSDTLATVSLLINTAGNALVWGLTVPLFAWAILRTGAMARSVGWLGMIVAVFAGWLGLFAMASPIIEGLSNIGFPAFFVFMLSAGISILRRQRHRAQASEPATALLAPTT